MKNQTSVQQEKESLQECCVYFSENPEINAEIGKVEKFVGLKCIDGKLKIYFPVGFERPENVFHITEQKEIEKQNRKDVLNLISVLSSFGKKEEMVKQSDIFSEKQTVDFPINAYLFIINNFLNFGYYTEKEKIYKKAKSGKANWSRTIKQVRPQFINENIFYLDFITQKTNYNETALISQIHKYCVKESFDKIGFLFSDFTPEKSNLKLNKILFTSVIRSKAASTFNQENLMLFKSMIEIINYLDNSNEKNHFIYGTNNFHHIWEALVDKTFGEKDKDKFYPKVYWKLSDGKSFSFSYDAKRNSLRPDTIMITNRGAENQKIFVLDSKYYRYGVTKNSNHLPDSSSIVKQIAYAQYIDNEKSNIPQEVKTHKISENIYNAFIMPANLFEEIKMQNIGFSSADYVLPFSKDENSPEKTYYKIHGILLDVRLLMNQHSKNNKLIQDLEKIISRPLSFCSDSKKLVSKR